MDPDVGQSLFTMKARDFKHLNMAEMMESLDRMVDRMIKLAKDKSEAATLIKLARFRSFQSAEGRFLDSRNVITKDDLRQAMLLGSNSWQDGL